ncbi:glutamine--fructose-6-phosphate transaminase (isomerizing) [Gordonibacter urolithinfaciens]|uniref:Glutamine--fructose-6-phosphate aminotransferase [isomerizing] n=1 Tax=Gordonibacter urolithinfaciens TaxID=1335613 RepID=A0A423UJJ9_9ACTN|nr:glutamine--fructose-6-phosphate transaminase (isomerizing) [Gordonibacter urolithinfaciens]MBS6975643.1 glutamine--fructose-6-phosphate transaminase (isomerizing) [Eggerthellaceae bacterium]GKG91228.1 glutamine--fructose-6-phosphate aminotransferase [isomerizing] [Gordonibacter pamelaeae]MCB6561602.1 glutamine--fructose-6-phosphate transaminase (isomerizing) [Gordonibacter urolithinfaciens]MCB7085597.1 glutamine--fructose-6-phosphate transaminase (isomerizing) [Gordonibacter urolithinfaciens
MCGIVGYTGARPVKDILIEGLTRLEYRGYDSAGIAVEQDGALRVVHCKGKVSGLARLVEPLDLAGTCGIGHTRWATHGRPSEANAHPHTSCDGHVAVVHNGIIENFAELREELEARGHAFSSETDTEVVAHLVEEAYAESRDLLEAVREATERLIGAYAVAVISDQEPGTVVAARKDSPLVVGLADDGAYVASDIIAMIDATRDVAVLADGDFAKLEPSGATFFNVRGEAYEPEVTHVDWDLDVAEKGGYPDFMMKEIHEQPRVIRDTLAGRLVNGALSIDELDLSPEELNLIDRVCVIACGTSYHAGLIAKNLIEGWARIPCEVEAASEFRYRNPIITPSTLVVAVSQSGETADTLAAIRDARVKGAKVFGITNVVGSPVARESDGVIYTKANKEIAVASTKSFLGQVVSLTLLAMLLAQAKGKLKTNQVHLLFHELADTAEQVERILADTAAITQAARACKDASSALFVGRGMGAAIACEGALKLKEISYLHAEAYPAGEMKHGPIALIDEGFPVIAVATKSPVYDKLVSNLQEAKARGAMIVAVATEGDEDIRAHADHVVYIPKVRDAFSAVTASVPLQLFARAIAVERGCDVDQPRNLAKSVTVE